MEKWEYKVSVEPHWSNQGEIEKWLNEHGAEGWKVMRIPDDSDGFWYFRRRVQ